MQEATGMAVGCARERRKEEVRMTALRVRVLICALIPC